ncbi:MAG: leucine-rich repeat domain-containing protein [Tannerella sp.]|jgi:Leucine-rich repeat (LRR) protein|nr:leucine-rich repeat domain-containing protein [Tannerella sp.]
MTDKLNTEKITGIFRVLHGYAAVMLLFVCLAAGMGGCTQTKKDTQDTQESRESREDAPARESKKKQTDISTKFKDPGFLRIVREILSKSSDGAVYKTDCAGVTELTLIEKNLSSLAGIEYFTNLTLLDCRDNQLTSLPPLPKRLQTLVCHGNQIASLPSLPDVLTELDCRRNRLETLSSLPENLTVLYCEGNRLTRLPALPAGIKALSCYENSLERLDVSDHPELRELDCSRNKLTSLSLSGCQGLKMLVCNDNLLTALDISDCKNLQTLDCHNNRMENKKNVIGYNKKVTTIFEFDPQIK